jgi:exo-1,4-beta-D-glucosaminidase
MPGGGYFGTKKACEPVHVQYSYDDKSVVVVNTTSQSKTQLKLTAQVYDINLVEKFSKAVAVDVTGDSNVRAFSIPQIRDLSATYFLKLTLQRSTGQMVSSNFYWLSTTDDVLDNTKTKWYYTPVSSYADMTQLEKLPPVRLTVSGSAISRGDEENARVTISNPSSSLAFFVSLQIKQGSSDRDVLPVVWEENYLSLLPGESRTVLATYKRKNLANLPASLKVEAWNSPPIVIAMSAGRKR